MYVIVCTYGEDKGLFWNNENGWGDIKSADRFPTKDVKPPIYGEWIAWLLALSIWERAQDEKTLDIA